MKYFNICFLLSLAIVLSSCEEDFNPFGEYREQYVFNCILRGDTTLQVAAVEKTYTSGYNANANTEDPFIKGADVRVWYGDSVFIFKDTLISRLDTSRYKNQMNVYKCEKFVISHGQTVEAEVMLPNGRRLKSSIITPGKTLFESNSSTTIPAGSNTSFSIRWTNTSEGIYFLPDLSVKYYKKEGSRQVEYIKKIPAYYQDNKAVYFSPSRQSSVTIKIETLKKALEEIASDGDKSDYTIKLAPVFKVAAFDESLSRYYSVSSQTFDHLTVRVDESDYSNVEGGYGIFGAFTSAQYTNLKLYNNFITSLGYKVID